MKITKVFGLSIVLCLCMAAQAAQETNEVEQLRKQLQKLLQDFRTVQEQQQIQIEKLQKQVQELQGIRSEPAVAPLTVSPPATLAPPPVVTPAAAPASSKESQPAPGSTEAQPVWSPASPITLMGGQRNYLNLSFDALMAAGTSTANDLDELELGGHDPKQRGFTVQNLETVFEGKVDPYFRGQANVVMQIDPHGETTLNWRKRTWKRWPCRRTCSSERASS